MSELFLKGALMAVAVLTSTLSSFVVAESSRETPLVRAVQQARNSVVNIHTEKTAADDKESRFFSPKSRKVTGMGTGIVVDERGYIVTNYHVIQDVDVITVTMHNGLTFDGHCISYDRKHDLAIIRVNSRDPLTVMAMGTSSDLMLAETVFAVGNAFGYEDTITEGIISALHRDVEVDETQSYENLIQTSASINPGNSGGPLFNLNGEVIGINVAIRSGAQRIGFAIPIDDARRTIARLLSVERLNGQPHGLEASDVKSAQEKKLVVDRVSAGSAAELCGIQAGDVIRSVRGLAIADGTDFERSLLDMPRGKVLDVLVVRNGQEQTLQFTVGVGKTTMTPAISASLSEVVVASNVAPKVPAADPNGPRSTDQDILDRVWDLLGMRLESLTDTERTDVRSKTFQSPKGMVRYNGGLRIVSVRPDSAAAKFVKEGDVLLGLDGLETLGPSSLSYILAENRVSRMAAIKCQFYRLGSHPTECNLQLTR